MSCMQIMGDYDVCMHCGWIESRAQAVETHLPVRTLLAQRYEIGKVVGFGGFGIIYSAWDNSLDRHVAIKEYFPKGLVNRMPGETVVITYSGSRLEQYKTGLSRFLAEARSMARFSEHENIVNVTDFYEENGTAYIVMEFLDGVSLKEYLKALDQPLEIEEAIEIIRPVCNALEDMHKSGMIHRDISPDNIFLTSDGRVKLIDFGAARLASGEKEETLSVILKQGFAPPEQYRTKSRQGPFTDVYALAATCYRMITGNTPRESVDRAVNDTLQPPLKLGIGISKESDRAIMRGLAIDPDLRFQTIREFLTALEGRKLVRYPAEERKRRRRKNRRIAALIISLVVLLAGSAAVYYLAFGQIIPTTLTIWLPEYKDSVSNTNMQKLFSEQKGASNSVVAAFQNAYPHVDVQVQWFPENEYETVVRDAAESGTLPDLFYTTYIDAELISATRPVDDVLDSILSDENLDLIGLDNYETYFPSGHVLPTGLDVYVIYENQNLSEDWGMEWPEETLALRRAIAELSAAYGEGMDYLVVPSENKFALVSALSNGNWSAADQYSSATAENVLHEYGALLREWNYVEAAFPQEKASSRTAEELGVEQESIGCILGAISDIRWVQSSLPGYYAVHEMEHMPAVYTGLFCLGANQNFNTANASERFMKLLYSNGAQVMLSAQSNCTLPLDRKAMDMYSSIHSDIGFLNSQTVAELTLFGESWYLLPEHS